MMKKGIAIYVVFILAFVVFYTPQGVEGIEEDDVCKVLAGSIIVDPNGSGNYEKIQEAVNASTDGDTIFVWAGTYNESVKINKQITLIGNGSSCTTINGGRAGDVVHISGNCVTISGFKIMFSTVSYPYGAGVCFSSATNSTVSDCYFYSNFYGISMFDSRKNVVKDNSILSNIYGIYMERSSANRIENNDCINNSFEGIYGCESSNRNELVKNTCNYNNYGIYFHESFLNEIEYNDCSWNGDTGIRLFLSDENIVYNNTCNFNTAGIGIGQIDSNMIIVYDNINSSRNIVNNNTISYNTFVGIVLYRYCTKNTFMYNYISHNKFGIRLNASNRNVFMENIISRNTNTGLHFYIPFHRNSIYHNYILENV